MINKVNCDGYCADRVRRCKLEIFFILNCQWLADGDNDDKIRMPALSFVWHVSFSNANLRLIDDINMLKLFHVNSKFPPYHQSIQLSHYNILSILKKESNPNIIRVEIFIPSKKNLKKAEIVKLLFHAVIAFELHDNAVRFMNIK